MYVFDQKAPHPCVCVCVRVWVYPSIELTFFVVRGAELPFL